MSTATVATMTEQTSPPATCPACGFQASGYHHRPGLEIVVNHAGTFEATPDALAHWGSDPSAEVRPATFYDRLILRPCGCAFRGLSARSVRARLFPAATPTHPAGPPATELPAELLAFLRARLREDARAIRRDDRHWSEVGPAELFSGGRATRNLATDRALINAHLAAVRRGQPTADGLGDAVRIVAARYAGHAEYNPGWAP